MKKSILKKDDIDKFYQYVYFGDINNELDMAIKRAYRDFNRTLSGFANIENHKEIFNSAVKILNEEIIWLINSKISTQNEFDNWHKMTCDKLKKSFLNQKFHYGQAQKWINMTLKYYSMLKPQKVECVYEFFHVPIDRYIIHCTNYAFDCAWSKIDEYDKYLDFQKWFRNTYKGIPLDVEFRIWLNEVLHKNN